MHPDFPRSLDRLFRIVRREPRTASGQGVYTVIELSVAQPNLDQAVAYYREMYSHDERDGTEIIFTSNRGDFHVLRAERPQPKVALIPVRVA